MKQHWVPFIHAIPAITIATVREIKNTKTSAVYTVKNNGNIQRLT